jgi:hypothetical protein
MGIPFLTTRLQPYSKRCSLGTEGSKQHSVALIDGPNLVHHVYTALNDSARASGEPCTAADYATVWKATSKWLDDLKVFGYDVYVPVLLLGLNLADPDEEEVFSSTAHFPGQNEAPE